MDVMLKFGLESFLVICASRVPVEREHNRHPLPKVVYSSFSMKMALNCVHIWSVDLFLVKDKVPGRKLIKIASL